MCMVYKKACKRLKGVYGSLTTTCNSGRSSLDTPPLYVYSRMAPSLDIPCLARQTYSECHIVVPSGMVCAASPSPVRIRSSRVEKISVNKNAANDASVQ